MSYGQLRQSGRKGGVEADGSIELRLSGMEGSGRYIPSPYLFPTQVSIIGVEILRFVRRSEGDERQCLGFAPRKQRRTMGAPQQAELLEG